MFYGVSRSQVGKVVNNDAFLTAGNLAFIMDGCGETQGRTLAVKCHLSQVITGRKREGETVGIKDVLGYANRGMLGTGFMSTFVGVEVNDGRVRMFSVGDSYVYLYRSHSGTLERINESNMGRLGSDIMTSQERWLDARRGDVLLLTSDGYTVDKYRTLRQIQKFMLKPADLPHALLELNQDRSDDCTIVTKVL